MQSPARNDDRVMSLFELALSRLPGERRAFLAQVCGADTVTFNEVWDCVQREQTMNGFLLDPLLSIAGNEELFAPGEVVDSRFRVVRKIAEGGMGVVYEAFDLKLDRRIAIKCARLGYDKRLPPEVRHASDISHPNVCKIFEIHTAETPHGDIDFITMEFLEGETLSERLRRGRLPENLALTIARQLCSGLTEAHARYVVHGDLKSSNVILTEDSHGAVRAVITDFGLAHRCEPKDHADFTQRFAGTPGYMAPELWDGQKASVSSDVYALGVILFELATGKAPFLAGQEASWEERFAPKPPPPAGKNWDRTIRRCLDPDPGRRFASPAAVAVSLAPPRRRLLMAAAAGVFAAVVSAIVAHQIAVSPAKQVRLALLPFEGEAAAGIFKDASSRIGKLKGDSGTGFTVVGQRFWDRGKANSISDARVRLGATHVLRADSHSENGEVVLRAVLVETRADAVPEEWQARYSRHELRYGSAALAGFVTASFAVPPAENAVVESAAQADYQAGAALVRTRSRTEEALMLLNRALAVDRDSPLIWATLAEAQLTRFSLTQDQKWLAHTAESVRQAQMRNQDLAPVHRISGLLSSRLGRYERAVAEYERAIQLEPNNSDGYRRLGNVYVSRGELDEAMRYVRRAVEAEPTFFRTWWDLGSVHFELGEYTEAANAFQQAVTLAPEESGARLPLARAYINLGRFVDAEREINKALSIQETPQALRALAKARAYQGRNQEAVPSLLKAIEHAPNAFEYWLDLGHCYRRLGRKTEAARSYLRSQELVVTELARDPRRGKVRSYLAHLAARLGDFHRAEEEIRQAINLFPADSDTQFNAALTFEAIGKREQTFEVLRSASRQTLDDLSRSPDLADLASDPRFIQLKTAARPDR
ncbi:MAG: tetratricopeptide repeat protein [Bryobacteraceae bacterium]|nr:tetratricopeptide repeat protein [Bryobacteraceae bacterium]